MSILKRDTTPLTIDELVKLNFKLNPYEYTIYTKGLDRILIIKSPNAVPDIINDLEYMVEKIENSDLEEATAACLLGSAESTNISLSILWSLIDRRKEHDQNIVKKLSEHINRSYGTMLFTADDDPNGMMRLAIRLPVPVRLITEDNLPGLLSDTDIPRQGEVVYIIGDDGFKRFNGKKFFKVIERDEQVTMSAGPSPILQEDGTPTLEENNDDSAGAKAIRATTPHDYDIIRTANEMELIHEVDEELLQYMPKITYGGTPSAKERETSAETDNTQGILEEVAEGLDVDTKPHEDMEANNIARSDFAPFYPESDMEAAEEGEVGNEEELTCPICGHPISQDDTVCPNCGADIEVSVETNICECPRCGASIPCDAKECPMCGLNFIDETQEGSIASSVGENEYISEEAHEVDASADSEIDDLFNDEDLWDLETDKQQKEQTTRPLSKIPIGDDDVHLRLENILQTTDDRDYTPVKNVTQPTHDEMIERMISAFVSSGTIVERKEGIMGIDLIVKIRKPPEYSELSFVAKYMDTWTEDDAILLDKVVTDYNLAGGFLIGRNFPIDVRLYITNRRLYMVDINELNNNSFDIDNHS